MAISADELVQAELKHIGEAADGSDQASLRSEYAAFRREDLARDPKSSPREALAKAIASVHRYAPDFSPEYEAGFFTVG